MSGAMKLKFKVQPYQTNTVDSVVDCFAGQPMVSSITYRIDPGRKAQTSAFEEGFKNADLQLPEASVLANIKEVQRRQNLPISEALVTSAGCKFNLDVEMETGTGKTYCYIKTIFEMNKRYGWSKFIIMVPSIAIREGVYKSLQIEPSVFDQFKKNPEHFISEASRIISEQKATMIIERLSYDEVSDRYGVDIFTANQTGQDFSRASAKLKNHIYDYVVTGSDIERQFVGELDTSTEVVVYAKLPRGFLIPTPVGDYNPDWAISFKKGSVKHIYFIAETKGTMSSLQLRETEKIKIACAKKFFDEIGKRISQDRVKYDVVMSYEKLMDVVGRGTVAA